MIKTLKKQDLKKIRAQRLRDARKAAGFKSMAAAARQFRWTESTYFSHEDGRRAFDEDDAAKYAPAFGVSIAHLMAHDEIIDAPHHGAAAGGADEKPRPKPNASFPPRYQQFPGDVAIPLRGQISAGPNGRFIMNGQDIAQVFCPPGLEDVEGAYAVQIQGTSGEPRFYNGETAWINPHARVRQGDDVIVQILGDNPHDEVSSYIKRFVSRSNDVLRLYQYNPGEGEEHNLEFDASKVFSVHKVVFHALL